MRQRRLSRAAIGIVAPVVLSGFSQLVAQASTYTWVGSSPARTWANPADWSGSNNGPPFGGGGPPMGGGNNSANGYPMAGDTAVLTDSDAGSIYLQTDQAADALEFDNVSTGYTISTNSSGTGSSTLSLNSINISPSGSSFGNEDVFDSSVTIAAATSGPLTIAYQPFRTSNTQLDFQGVINAPGGLVISSSNGAANVILDNTENVLGSISVAGTLNVQSAANLGGASVQFNGLGSELNLLSTAPAQNFGTNLTVSTGATGSVNEGGSGQTLGDTTQSTNNFGSVTLNAGSVFGAYGYGAGNIFNFTTLNLNGLGYLNTQAASFFSRRTFMNYSGGIVDQAGGSSLNIGVAGQGGAGGVVTLNAASTNYTGTTTVSASYLIANADGALGSGNVIVNADAALGIGTAQTVFNPTTVAAYGAIGGNLTNAVYGGNVTLSANNIILAGTTNAPTRASTGGATDYLGITNTAGTYTVGDTGTNIYKGAALGNYTNDGGFTGTVNEAVAGQGIQLYLSGFQALGNAAGTVSPTFNTTSNVSMLWNNGGEEIAFFSPLAGTAKAYDLSTTVASRLFAQDWSVENTGVVPSGTTVTVHDGTFLTFYHPDDVAGTVVIGSGAYLYHDTTAGGATTGTYHINQNGTMYINDPGGGPGHGANYVWDVGSVVDVNLFGTLSTASATNANVSWFSPTSDLLVNSQTAFTGKGITLGNNRRISTQYGAILSGGAGITAASGAGTIILSAADNTTLDITDNVTTPQTLQIGSTPWSYNGLSQSGTVILDGTVNVGTLNLVAGALEIAKGATNVTITNTTVGAAATIEGGGTNINATRLDLFGHISPGHSPGQFATGAATTFEAGSQYQWQINHEGGTPGNEAAGWDLFTTSSSLSLLATPSDPMTVTVESLDPNQNPDPVDDFDPTKPMAFAFIQDASLSAFNPAAFTLDLSQFQNAYSGTWSVQEEADGTTLDIVYTPTAVPEPASLSILAFGTLMLKRRARAK